MGLGYVGLPLATTFAEAGVPVLGLDAVPSKVEQVNAGRSYIEDVSSERLRPLTEAGRLRATTSWDEMRAMDAVIICLPTPLTEHREPDLSAVLGAAESLASRLRKGQLVVLESTTYPGTTREELAPVLERSGLIAGRDFNLAFSPERVDPGRVDWTTRTTPKVVGGLTPACTRAAADLYAWACDTLVEVSSPEVAEMTKLLENIFRAVNIALVNELAVVCDRMGINDLGGDRRRRDQAVRVHAVPPGPGPRRPLHPDRPLLPHVEGARVRPAHRVHRARREGQLADAGLLRGQGGEGPQQPPPVGQRQPRAAARRGLQGRT